MTKNDNIVSNTTEKKGKADYHQVVVVKHKGLNEPKKKLIFAYMDKVIGARISKDKKASQYAKVGSKEI